VEFFKEVIQSTGYALTGSLYDNQKVFTAMGTERISGLVPPSMFVQAMPEVEKIIAVGFKNYPDFFPQMFLDNLHETHFPEAVRVPITVDLGIKETIRSNHLSLLLEREDVLAQVVSQIFGSNLELRTEK
jgi:anaerobic glycerol-3-phosphate dehydrogenase